MADIYFGNVATFYSSDEIPVEDASYDGKNTRQEQTRFTILCLREYFREHGVKQKKTPEAKSVANGNAEFVDEFFSWFFYATV